MSRLKILLAVLGILHGFTGPAQVIDDFLDGDFQTAPVWQGDGTKFLVSGGRLKLQATPVSGSAMLSTPSKAIHEARWEISVQLDFTPSSTNYAKVYLVSDKPDLQSPLNGYFVKIGNTSREVSLYSQQGSTETELIDGLDDRVNQPIVNVTCRVTRSAAGIWELFSDVGGTGTFVKEGTATDVVHTVSTWFGIQCVYSATRSDKFWFDDFVVTGSAVPDTSPPSIVRLEAPDPLHFSAVFSEPLDPERATALTNVRIESIGSPQASALLDPVTVRWTLSNPLINGVVYNVEFSGISDGSGNQMPPTIKSILYFLPGTPKTKSVIVTEIFPDPSPQLGLPATEYVEIFNRSETPFDLKGWKLSDEGSTGILPASILLPGAYKVIATSSAVTLFNSPAQVIGISNFPSLNNTGDIITIRDAAGVTIDSVQYSIDWFRDEDKAQGGWSLELIDVNNPCGQGDNWTASEDDRGGTPGMANSVLADKPDRTPPIMLSAQSTDASTISIAFNEVLMRSSVQEAHIGLIPEVAIDGIFFRDQTCMIIDLKPSALLQPRMLYTIAVRDIQDCNGNTMEPATWTFGLPEPADSLDMIISEVLFNPRPGGADFVELFNVSEKFIDLSGWTLGTEDSRSTLEHAVLHPHSFIVVTSDPVAIQSHYPQTAASGLLKANVPNFPDDEGSVLVADNLGRVMDRLMYTRKWHSEFLRNDEGVSLERIDEHVRTQEKSNWASASSLYGYATPGYPNSQHRPTFGTTDEVQIVPEIFVPGKEAFNFVQIQYRFDQPGRMASARIFNHQGASVKWIANNELLGREGFLRWDGDQDDGSQASAGYYVIWFETFDATGSVSTFRKRIVIAGH